MLSRELLDDISENQGILWVLNSYPPKINHKSGEVLEHFGGLYEHAHDLESEVRDELEAHSKDTKDMHRQMRRDLDSQLVTVDEISSSFDIVSGIFQRSADDIRRIGDRLSTADEERKRLQYAKNLVVITTELEKESLDVVESNKSNNDDDDSNNHNNTNKSLLPPFLRDKDEITICNRLHEMRNMIADINSPELQVAKSRVMSISENLENKLLDKFENTWIEIEQQIKDGNLRSRYWENKGVIALLQDMRSTVNALNSFNNGFSVQKRFLFRSLQRVENRISEGVYYDSEYEINAVDHLSNCFNIIGEISYEQFEFVRQVFPVDGAGKICRLILQRIFSDPTINLQGRIESVLNPKPPMKPLGLADRLDTLAALRVKFTALHISIGECLTKSFKMSKHHGVMLPSDDYTKILSEIDINDDIYVKDVVMMSVHDVSDLITDLVDQILENNLDNYSSDEIRCLHYHYRFLLTSSVGDQTNLLVMKRSNSLLDTDADYMKSVMSVSADVPSIVPDRFESIPQFLSTIGNMQFIDECFSASEASLRRITCIASSQKIQINQVKDIFRHEIYFMTNCILLPWVNVLKIGVSKLRSSNHVGGFLRGGRSSKSLDDDGDTIKNLGGMRRGSSLSRNSRLNSTAERDIIEGIVEWCVVFQKSENHWIKTFKPIVNSNQAETLICEQLHNKMYHTLPHRLREVMTSFAKVLLERFYNSLRTAQSKYDFSPKDDETVNVEEDVHPTVACTTVCMDMLRVCTLVRTNEDEIMKVSGKSDAHFWKLINTGFIGLLLIHIRSYIITAKGARVLCTDLMQYKQTLIEAKLQEATIMLNDMLVICSTLKSPPDRFEREINELSRVYDASVVDAIAYCRPNREEFMSSINRFRRNPADHIFAWEHSTMRNIVGPSTLRRKGSTLITSSLLTKLASRPNETNRRRSISTSSTISPTFKTSPKESARGNNSHVDTVTAKVNGKSSLDHVFVKQEATSSDSSDIPGLPRRKPSVGGNRKTLFSRIFG